MSCGPGFDSPRVHEESLLPERGGVVEADGVKVIALKEAGTDRLLSFEPPMMIRVVLVCPHCVKPFTRAKNEVTRSRRLSRPIYCSLSCSTKARSKRETRSCPCGKKFEVRVRKDSARHCSPSCASRFSMSEERREAQRKGGALGAKRFVENLSKKVDPGPDSPYPEVGV